jgi:hypothetical protein
VLFKDRTLEIGNLLISANRVYSIIYNFLIRSKNSSIEELLFIVSTYITKLPIEAAVKFKEYT